MNPLASRKQLLIAESELNRAQLVGDITALKADVRSLADRAQTLGSIAAAAAGLMNFLSGKPAPAASKPSRIQTVFKSIGLVSNLWLMFRGTRRKPKEE
jgi:hypothetical protein